VKPFELIFEKSDPAITAKFFKIKGYLDAHTVLQFDVEVEKVLDQEAKYLVFDLSELQYISSSGIGSLMGVTQKLNKEGGDLVLTKLSQKVDNIFDLLGFNKIFTIAASNEEAIEMLKGNSAN